jgi:hypothetical protein
MKRKSDCLRETPLARYPHRRRHLEELAARTLFQSQDVERQLKQKAIDDAHIAFLRWLKRGAK